MKFVRLNNLFKICGICARKNIAVALWLDYCKFFFILCFIQFLVTDNFFNNRNHLLCEKKHLIDRSIGQLIDFLIFFSFYRNAVISFFVVVQGKTVSMRPSSKDNPCSRSVSSLLNDVSSFLRSNGFVLMSTDWFGLFLWCRTRLETNDQAVTTQ